MTDAPVSTAPAPDPATPDSQLAPILLALAPSLVTLAQQSADISGSIKTAAENLGVPWVLPYLSLGAAVLAVVGAVYWHYRRAVSRSRPWALWVRNAMPWNRGG